MAGEIKHKWNGTILTITSDSGKSSCDLKGRQGDDGCRGPQGPAGIITDANGQLVFEGIATEDYVNQKIQNIEVEATVDLSNYYTKGEVDATIANIVIPEIPEVDLDGYATEDYVNQKIDEARVEGANLNNYYTKSETMSAVEAKGYQTASQVNSIVTGKGYQTAEQVREIVLANLPSSGEEVYY